MDNDLTWTRDIVRKAKGGDRRAFDRLFERYCERVRRAVRVRLSRRLRATMETADILLPAFTKAFRNFDRFEMRGEGSLLHWLAEYAYGQVHDVVDYVNAIKRKPPAGEVRLGAEDDSRAIDVPARVPDPGEEAARGEHELAVEACLDELPKEYTHVIVLRDNRHRRLRSGGRRESRGTLVSDAATAVVGM